MNPDIQPTLKGMVYCTTPALDEYPLHLDKIHHTWMMTSLYIYSMTFYDLQHHHLHPSSSAAVHHLLLTNIYFHLS